MSGTPVTWPNGEKVGNIAVQHMCLCLEPPVTWPNGEKVGNIAVQHISVATALHETSDNNSWSPDLTI